MLVVDDGFGIASSSRFDLARVTACKRDRICDPLRPLRLMQTHRLADEPELGGTSTAIILVVDRDPHVRELETHFLNQAGFSVGFEKDGDGALEQARKVVPDIVITEILVPALDGLALCRRLKADPRTRDTAVLVFSILAAADRAREAGADAFLLKPLVEHILVDTVRELLEARSARIARTRHER